MYLHSKLFIRLPGSTEMDEAPSGIFKGLANLVTQGTWSSHDQVETVRTLSIVEGCIAAVETLGKANLVGLYVGHHPLMHARVDLHGLDADAALKRLTTEDQSADPHAPILVVFQVRDDDLITVVRATFTRHHVASRTPIVVELTAIPAALVRKPVEREEAYIERVSRSSVPGLYHFTARLDDLTNRISKVMTAKLGSTPTDLVSAHPVVTRGWTAGTVVTRTHQGQPLHGFDPYLDLSSLSLNHDIHRYRRADTGFWSSVDSTDYSGGDSGSDLFFHSSGHHAGHDGEHHGHDDCGWFDDADDAGDCGSDGGDGGDGGGGDGGGGDGGGGD